MQAKQCSKEIDGPKINGAGTVAWRKRCQNRTTHPTGRCRFHPLQYASDEGRKPWYPGERAVDHNFVHRREDRP